METTSKLATNLMLRIIAISPDAGVLAIKLYTEGYKDGTEYVMEILKKKVQEKGLVP